MIFFQPKVAGSGRKVEVLKLCDKWLINSKGDSHRAGGRVGNILCSR